jgi:hypothetical protein
MKYIVSIDGTICSRESFDNVSNAIPYPDRIAYLNNRYEQGHEVVYWTDRPVDVGFPEDVYEFTQKQLADWGCEYSRLAIGKPVYDVWIDDKADWVFESDTFLLFKRIMESEIRSQKNADESWLTSLRKRMMKFLTR